MKILEKIVNVLKGIEYWVTVPLFVLMLVLMILQVIPSILYCLHHNRFHFDVIQVLQNNLLLCSLIYYLIGETFLKLYLSALYLTIRLYLEDHLYCQ